MTRNALSCLSIGLLSTLLAGSASGAQSKPPAAPRSRNPSAEPTTQPGSQSIAQIQAEVQRDPNNPKLHIALGIAYWDRNDYRARPRGISTRGEDGAACGRGTQLAGRGACGKGRSAWSNCGVQAGARARSRGTRARTRTSDPQKPRAATSRQRSARFRKRWISIPTNPSAAREPGLGTAREGRPRRGVASPASRGSRQSDKRRPAIRARTDAPPERRPDRRDCRVRKSDWARARDA